MNNKTKRVASFMVMCIAHLQCSDQISDPPTEEQRKKILFSFMGSGASDNLTIGDVIDFIDEVNKL